MKKFTKIVLRNNCLNNCLMRKTAGNIFAKPSILIRKKLKQVNINTLTSIDLNLIRHNIFRTRSLVRLLLLQSTTKTHTTFKSIHYRTNGNDTFVLVNNSENSIIDFFTEWNLNVSYEIMNIYMNRIFNDYLKFFIQLLIIHELKDDIF